MKKSAESIREREERIVSYIEQEKSVRIETLCDQFEVSASTARLILKKLASEGRIRRTFGGADSVFASEKTCASEALASANTSFAHYKEKCAIAHEAVSFVREGDIISISGGSTTHLFAKELAKINNIAVVTNSIWVANELCTNPTIQVRVSGGDLNPKKGSLIGPIAERYFENLHFDKMFLGVDSVDSAYGVTSQDSYIAFLQRNILSKSKEVYVLADYTKFIRGTSIERIARFQEITALITDDTTDKTILQNIQSQGTTVHVGDSFSS